MTNAEVLQHRFLWGLSNILLASIQTKEEEADVVPVIGWLEVFATAEQQQY